MITLGKHLKQLRKNQRYSQQQLANQIGVSRKLIGEIESGKGTSLLTFIKLLKVFNKTEKLLEIFKVGHLNYSETKLPSTYYIEKTKSVFIDLPGFGDNDSVAVDICTAAWLKKL